MARTKSVEEIEVENAPIVEETEVENAPAVEHVTAGKAKTPEQIKRAEEAAARKALGEQVEALFTEQFGGEDREPVEGVARWDDMVRELSIEADALETQYRTVLTAKENNRTLLRALAAMGKVPSIVPDYYYPPKAPRGSRA